MPCVSAAYNYRFIVKTATTPASADSDGWVYGKAEGKCGEIPGILFDQPNVDDLEMGTLVLNFSSYYSVTTPNTLQFY